MKQHQSSPNFIEKPQAHGLLGLLAYAVPDAVRVSGLSRATLYREIAAGRLKVRKCGKRTLVLASDLQAFLYALPVGGSDDC